MEDKIFTSSYITQSWLWIHCLKAGQKEYTFTQQQLSDLVNRVFADGYQFVIKSTRQTKNAPRPEVRRG